MHHRTDSKRACLSRLKGTGCVKIVGFTGTEMWHQDRPPAPVIKALAMIMVELMQKLPAQSGMISVRNPERWPLESNATKFLVKLGSTSSLSQLTTDAFVDPKNWEPWDLIPLIRKALATTLPPSRLDPDEESGSDS
ncbi:hypothetical protein VTN77DRAFT_353 [Rasamsonia byssochlamydoides]|uniref:uncharacterized protein n=1 Tax=Rasamsonia byssochlamydoides TaxID=89139 RepID=UPI00374267B7